MKSTRFSIKALLILTTLVFGLLSSAYAGYPQTITTSYPFINLPRPTDDQRWAEAFSHWDKRKNTSELIAAVNIFESLANDNPSQLEPHLWLARSLYLASVREPKKAGDYLKRGIAAADKVLAIEPGNVTARFWRYNMLVFIKEFSETEYAEITEFFVQFRNLPMLPVPDDDPLWDEAVKLWKDRLNSDELQKLLAVVERGKDVPYEEIKPFYQGAIDAIKAFEKLNEKYPHRIEPKLWLALTNNWMYSYSFDFKHDVDYTEVAVHWAHKALEQEPLSPAANFLYAFCLTNYSEKSLFTLVRNIRKIARCVNRSAEENPYFYYGGHSWLTNVGLASIGKIVIKILKIMGHSIETFEVLGRFMTNCEPNFFRSKQYLARMMKTIGKEEEAKKEFESIINSDPTVLKSWESDNRIFQYRTMKILKEEFKSN